MGSLPKLSILKGETRSFSKRKLYRLFEDVVEDISDDTLAVVFEENKHHLKHVTYKQLNIIANQLARQIVRIVNDSGVTANTDGDFIIAVSMPPSDKLITTLLAIWKAGCAYLPLDPSFPQTRITHILNESQPVLTIYDQSDNDGSSFDNTLSINYNQLINNCVINSITNLNDEEQLHHKKDDIAIILYTSGSTGIPKGVRLPFSIISNRLQWQWKQFPYSATETFSIFKTALTFVDSVSEIWGPLLSGLTIVCVPKSITKDPAQLIHILDQYKIERLVLVPSLLRSMLLYLRLDGGNKLNNLKLWVCSGETLSVQLVEEFFNFFNNASYKLCNFYGSTEIMGDVTYYVINNIGDLYNCEKIPIGRPIDNTIIYLVDNNLKPVNLGDVGELYVSGANLALGYVNRRDPDKFIDNLLLVDPAHSRLYKTGDYARIVKGQIQYEGRTDSQIKIRGHRVDLTEVEKQVYQVADIDKGVVLCYKPGEMEQALVAFVTIKNNSTITETQIEDILHEKLTSYMIPQVIILENIPLLVNGKIDRQTLLKMYDNLLNDTDNDHQIQIDYSNIPQNQLEAAQILLETVANVIGRSTRTTLSLKSNFFQLGGNSLNSVYTVTKLREQGYSISVTDFLKSQTLYDVLNRITLLNNEIYQNNGSNGYDYDEYFVQSLNNNNRQAVVQMITDSFYEKADLEQWLKPHISRDDYIELLDKSWEPLIEKNLSFVICRKDTGQPVGVSLNFDARDEPEIDINSKLVIIFEFLEFIEGPIRDNQLPQGKGTVLHSFMMGTDSKLASQENVLIIQIMEEETLRMAKKNGFSGIFTTNTSPLTQQLGTDIYGYQVMNDYQVNQYVASDKTRPFAQAPDSQRAVVSWKPI